MNTAKDLISSLLKLALAPFYLTLSADSDWIRYGLPAILLTVIFFVAMRSNETSVVSPHLFSAKTGSIKPAPPALLSGQRARLPMTDGDNPASRAMTSTFPALPGATRPPSFGLVRSPAGSATEAATADPHWADGLSEQQKDGRRAVCDATRRVYQSVKRGKRRKNKAMQTALGNYGNGADFDTANLAVTKALDDYGRGAWSEEKCNPGPGLPKGAIGLTFR